MSNEMSKRPKRNKRRRLIIGLTALLLVSAIGIGAVYAWNMHEASQENILQSHDTIVRINETFPDKTITPGGTKTKQASFSNTGSSPVFVRVAYSEMWTNGTAWLEDDGTHATKNWTAAWASDWWDGGDGFYYYKKVLAAGGSTGNILNSVTFPAALEAEYANGQYDLNFLVEAVQLSDEAAVNTDATQKVFGKTATVTITNTSNGAVTAGTVSWS